MEKTDIFSKDIKLTQDNLKTDSREVAPGDIFIAIKGTLHDGHDYIKEAMEKGASCVVCEHEGEVLKQEEKTRIVKVEDTRIALGEITKLIFDNPSGKLSTYGVTGTNGKTTTVFLIDGILNNSGRPSGLISTVYIKKEKDLLEKAVMTTPDQLTINRSLAGMIASGKKSAVLEISSHALDQRRVWGIELDSAVFTNITPEHLDYHGDMETYLEAKSRIFDNLKEGGVCALNFDDSLVMSLKSDIDSSRVLTFGITEGADVRAEKVELSVEGTSFEINSGKLGRTTVKSRLVGMHNVYNALAAACALSDSGLSLGEIKEGLENAPAVPGRLERIESEAPFMTFVDYAHTPDALKNVLECMRPMTDRHLVCVFGCGGDRDPSKRPVMGKIASDICDSVVLTNDNPRTEDPGEILGEIEKGMPNENNYSIISERQEAIYSALKGARKGDVIIIAGKGHEDYQIIGDRKTPFDDRIVAKEALKELGY